MSPFQMEMTCMLFATLKYSDINNDSPLGMIKLGTPEQILYVQFDTTFDGILVQTSEDSAWSLEYYNRSDSTTWVGVLNDEHQFPVSKYTFSDGSMALANPAYDTSHIGDETYGNTAFGEVCEYNPLNSGHSTPFGGASGTLGFNTYPFPWLSSQLVGNIQTDRKCYFDLSRAEMNGTWALGSPENPGNQMGVAWTKVNHGNTSWSINITAISAGSRRDSPVQTWSATVSTANSSLYLPQKVLDWYFEPVFNATWWPVAQTYQYPCDTSLPDFEFGLGNGTFTIPGDYLPYEHDEAGTNCITLFRGDNSSSPNHEYTFGSRWVELGILILDYDSRQVGFMNKSSPLPAFDVSSLHLSGAF